MMFIQIHPMLQFHQHKITYINRKFIESFRLIEKDDIMKPYPVDWAGCWELIMSSGTVHVISSEEFLKYDLMNTAGK